MNCVKIISAFLLLIVCSSCANKHFSTHNWYKNGSYPKELDNKTREDIKMEVFGKATVYVNGKKTNRCSIVVNGNNDQLARLDSSNLFYLASNDKIKSLNIGCYDRSLKYIGGIISGKVIPSIFFYKDLGFKLPKVALGKAHYAGDIRIDVDDPKNEFGKSGILGIPRDLDAKISNKNNFIKTKKELIDRFGIKIINPIAY